MMCCRTSSGSASNVSIPCDCRLAGDEILSMPLGSSDILEKCQRDIVWLKKPTFFLRTIWGGTTGVVTTSNREAEEVNCGALLELAETRRSFVGRSAIRRCAFAREKRSHPRTAEQVYKHNNWSGWRECWWSHPSTFATTFPLGCCRCWWPGFWNMRPAPMQPQHLRGLSSHGLWDVYCTLARVFTQARIHINHIREISIAIINNINSTR